MADPRVAPVVNFTQTLHHDPTPSNDPSRVRLPSPYTVCILGASRGIGAGIARSYVLAGASTLIITSRHLSDLSAVAAGLGALNPDCHVEALACDVSQAASVRALADAVRAKFGRLDVLVANAGLAGPWVLRIDQGEPDDFQRAFDVNAVGTYLAAHCFVPLLLATEGGAKAFVAVGSLAAGVLSGPLASTGYCVSKMAQARIVEHVATQFREQGLLAVTVHPGAVKTEASKGAPEEFVRCESSAFPFPIVVWSGWRAGC